MALDTRLGALAIRIANYLRDSVLPRLPPATGTTGYMVTKAASGYTLAAVPDISGKANSASPTFTGAIAQNGSVRTTARAIAALAIDCAAGNFFTKTIAADSTLTFSNVPATGTAYACVVALTHTSGTLTHPTGTIFSDAFSGVAPTLPTGKTHLLYYQTNNGGTTWRCSVLKGFSA